MQFLCGLREVFQTVPLSWTMVRCLRRRQQLLRGLRIVFQMATVLDDWAFAAATTALARTAHGVPNGTQFSTSVVCVEVTDLHVPIHVRLPTNPLLTH